MIGSTVIIRDVTAKMEWEQRIYHTEKLASIGNLAAGVAHEINNPLAVMLGFTDLLLERAQPGTADYEDLKVIAESGKSARKIVENLLGFARVTEGLEDTVDVHHCIRTVAGIVKNTLMTAKVELVNEVPEGLPRVCGDSREYQQVVFNLINNSVAVMKDEGGTLTLSAEAEDGLGPPPRDATPGRGSPTGSRPGSSTPSSPPRRSARAPGWASRSATGSSPSTGAASASPARAARTRPTSPRAPPSRCRCRCATGARVRPTWTAAEPEATGRTEGGLQ